VSINYGAGAGGVGSATEPGPTAVNVKAEQSVYANNNPAPQAHFDDDAPPSFERVVIEDPEAIELRNRKCELELRAQPSRRPTSPRRQSRSHRACP
jgi:hypothetical protein